MVDSQPLYGRTISPYRILEKLVWLPILARKWIARSGVLAVAMGLVVAAWLLYRARHMPCSQA
jgi:hypothetical protein